MQKKQYHQAQINFEKCLLFQEKLGDKGEISIVIVKLAEVYKMQGKYALALEYYKKGAALSNEINLPKTEADNLQYIALLYYDLAKDDQLRAKNLEFSSMSKLECLKLSEDYALQSLAIIKKIKSPSSEKNNLKILSDIYQLSGNYIAALTTFKEYTTIKDSLHNDATRQEIMRQSIQYDYSKKEDALKYINQLSASQLQQQILVSKQQQQALQISQQALLLSQNERDLQSLNFQKSQTELKLNNQAHQQELLIRDKERLLQAASVNELNKNNALAKLKLRQQWLYSGIALLFLLGIGSFFLYRNNIQKTKLKAALASEKAEQEKNAALFQSKMSDAALNSLKSQMNPHFIFNCLNSIKLYAAKNDSVAATHFLSKFSKLMRLVLENSKSERITLNKEIETLGLYLEMEGMRFKQKLHYEILTTPHIDKDNIEIPPMIIQPFVENAIWHGLMHKEEGGNLAIHFSESEGNLIIKITDNGIGRQAANEIKLNHNINHKSFGMHITNERIELLNQKYNTQATVTINDLYENSIATGTEVIIKIPIL